MAKIGHPQSTAALSKAFDEQLVAVGVVSLSNI
jgi:hypothetical protein